MADKVSLAYRQWQDKLQTAVRMASAPDTSYIKVHSESLVGLFTCVFVKSAQRESLREIDITTVKRGIGGIYGNKVSWATLLHKVTQTDDGSARVRLSLEW